MAILPEREVISMYRKKILNQERVRKVPLSFSWIDHRLITHGLIAELYPLEILLYVFLVMVGDRYGLSYYGDEKICQLLRIDQPSLYTLRKNLILKSFIEYADGIYQVLALPIEGD